MHFVSSLESLNQITDLSLAPQSTSGRGARPSITPSTAAVAAASTSASPIAPSAPSSGSSENAQEETTEIEANVSLFKLLDFGKHLTILKF